MIMETEETLAGYDREKKPIDRDGLILCDLQARAFELSVDYAGVSSAVFVRRFMNSRAAKWMDGGDILATNMQAEDLLEMIEEQYGPSEYGSRKFSRSEMHWIGYVYRYYAYTCEQSSARVYRKLKPDELRNLYLPYHTLDPSQAVERILEAKGKRADQAGDIMRQYEVFRRVRGTA